MSSFERALSDAGIDVEVRRFPEGTRTAADAARAVGCEIGQIVKSLIFTAAGEPVLVMMGGDGRVHLDRLAAVAGAPVGKADAALVREATGYAIGGVPPFGHARRLQAFIDKGLMRFDVVWAAAGRPDSVFAISPDRLIAVSGATVVDIAEGT